MNFTPPPGPVPPMANLQQMALQAFRPPPPMSMPGMGGMQMPQAQSQGMPGMGGLGAALGMMGRAGTDRTAGGADMGGYGGSPPLDASGNAMSLPNPNGNQYGPGGALIGAIPGGQGGGMDLLQWLSSKVPSFGGGGSGG